MKNYENKIFFFFRITCTDKSCTITPGTFIDKAKGEKVSYDCLLKIYMRHVKDTLMVIYQLSNNKTRTEECFTSGE